MATVHCRSEALEKTSGLQYPVAGETTVMQELDAGEVMHDARARTEEVVCTAETSH